MMGFIEKLNAKIADLEAKTKAQDLIIGRLRKHVKQLRCRVNKKNNAGAAKFKPVINDAELKGRLGPSLVDALSVTFEDNS